MTISRAEVIPSVERRRRWSRDEKERPSSCSIARARSPLFPRWLAWPVFKCNRHEGLTSQ